MAAILAVVTVLSVARAAGPGSPAPGVIRGQVKDHQGEPFGFVHVALAAEDGATGPWITLADEEGRFEFPLVPVGSYELRVLLDSCSTTVEAHIGVADAAVIELDGIRCGRQDGGFLRWQATGVVSGEVHDDEGIGLGFADVCIEEEGGGGFFDCVLTDEDGRFSIPAPIGSYTLSAFAEGRRLTQSYTAIPVTPGSQQAFTLTLLPIITDSFLVSGGRRIPDVLSFAPGSRRDRPGGRERGRP